MKTRQQMNIEELINSQKAKRQYALDQIESKRTTITCYSHQIELLNESLISLNEILDELYRLEQKYK